MPSLIQSHYNNSLNPNLSSFTFREARRDNMDQTNETVIKTAHDMKRLESPTTSYDKDYRR